MPIISSVPALNSIVKGVGATFTLDKTELLLVPSVAADPYFSDDANWATVQLVYQSTVGNDPEQVVFDASLASPTGIFNVAATARDIFDIQSILILNAQGGFIVVPRAELTVVDFDVDMSPPSGILTFEYFSSPDPLVINGNGLENNTSVVGYAIDTTPMLGGNFDVTFTVTGLNSLDCFSFGLTKSLTTINYNDILMGIGFSDVSITQFPLLGVQTASLSRRFNGGGGIYGGPAWLNPWQANMIPANTYTFRLFSDNSTGLVYYINDGVNPENSAVVGQLANFGGNVYPYVALPTSGNIMISAVDNLA